MNLLKESVQCETALSGLRFPEMLPRPSHGASLQRQPRGLVEVEERHTERTNARASPPVRRDHEMSTQQQQFAARVMLIIIGRWYITTPHMANLRT